MNTVLEQTLTAAKNIDTLNGSFIHVADLPNGSVFTKGNKNSAQVYEVGAIEAGALDNLWMASNPVDVVLTDVTGNQYKPGILDPRAFTNKSGLVFSAFKPQKGDLITITADGFTNEYEAGTHLYANVTAGSNKLTFGATQTADALSFAIVEVTYISIASASALGSQRVPAYLLECVHN